MIDILIVTHRLERLKKCLDKVSGFDANIIVVVDGFNQGIIDFLKTAANDKVISIILEKKPGKSEARNIGIKRSTADIIYFIDDDAYFDQDNIKVLEEKFKEYPDIQVIGGPNLTPIESSYFQRVSGYIFESLFTAWKMGNKYKRKIKIDRYSDDKYFSLCNLAVKKEVFDKENIYFDRRLHYNEENLLLEQLKEKGYKMIFSPELVVYHHRRENVFEFARQIYNSGKGRAIMTFIMPNTLSLCYIVPSLFLVYLVLAFFGFAGLGILKLYIIAGLFNSLWVTLAAGENIFSSAVVFVLSFIAHISYGFGFLSGLIWKKHI